MKINLSACLYNSYLHGPGVGLVIVTLDKVVAAELIVDAGEVGVGLDGDGLVPGELG